MTDTAISALRRRMIEDMTIHQLKPTTQHNYICFVKEFSIFFGRPRTRQRSRMSGATSFTQPRGACGAASLAPN